MVKQSLSWTSKGKDFVNCNVMEPVEHLGRKIVLPVSEPTLLKQQIERGKLMNYLWCLRKLLNTVFNEPTTLEDVCLKSTLVKQVNQTLLTLWC